MDRDELPHIDALYREIAAIRAKIQQLSAFQNMASSQIAELFDMINELAKRFSGPVRAPRNVS